MVHAQGGDKQHPSRGFDMDRALAKGNFFCDLFFAEPNFGQGHASEKIKNFFVLFLFAVYFHKQVGLAQ